MPKFGIMPKGQTPAPKDAVARAAQSDKPIVRTQVAVAVPANSIQHEGQHGGFSLPMLMAFILVLLDFGRPFDEFLVGDHIPVVLCILGAIVLMFTRWTPALGTRIGKPLIPFVIVLLIASVLSIWRVGSWQYLIGYFEVDIVLFLLLAAVPTTVTQIRWIAIMIVPATALLFIVGTKFDQGGRLVLKDSTVGNSDDVALFAGFCIPLVILFSQRLNKLLGIVVAIVGIAACLTAVELSGTRFALLALAVLAIYYFFRGSGFQRIMLVSCLTLIVIGSVALLPKKIIERLSTISSVSDDTEAVTASQPNEAVASTAARKELFFDGLQAFATHPLFGVGPQQFMNWRSSTLGKFGQPTHNTFLQIAADDGIFAIICYLFFMIGCIKTLRLCMKRFDGWEDGSQLAGALQASLLYFIVSAIALCADTHVQQYAVAGLAIALDRIRQQQLAAASEAAVPDVEQNSAQAPQAMSPKPLVRPLQPRLDPSREPERAVRYRFNRPVASYRKD